MLKKVKKRLFVGASAIVFAMGGGVPTLREAGIRIDLSVFAADIVNSGICGENAKWTLDSNGTLTISGTGTITDNTWNKNDVKKVIISYGITSVGGNSFNGCESLESITFSDSIDSIGSDAFSGCNNLKNVVLPKNLKSIGCNVFTSPYITNITIPKSVVSMGYVYHAGYSTFTGCKNLETVIFEDGITKIPDIALYCCISVKNIIIPEGVTSIGDRAFRGTSIESISLPTSLETIEGNSFWECGQLKDIIFPDNLKVIGAESFCGCTSLESATIPKNVKSIGSSAFSDVSKSFKILCYARTAGEKYAIDNGLEYELISEPAADTYIINEVSKYCTDLNDDFYKRVCAVFASGADWSVMQNELLKILSGKGINDIHEGMDYLKNYNKELSDALPYRMNYQYLISNEVYCASQFDRWLMSDEATAQRLLLYASGLIFNNELLGSVNLSTDLIEHYPEAKKNKEMLRDFLESTDKSFEVYSNAESTGKYINSALKVLGTDEVQRANIADLQKQMFSCKDDVEWKKLQKSYTAALAGDNIDKNGKVLINVKSISKALGKSTSALSFASATTDDIIKMINLENEVALYQENIKFLKTIVNSESATYAMRVAANSLLEDINLQYYRLTENILRRTFDFTLEMVDFDVWKEFFGEAAGDTIGNILGTYKLAVFISNMVIDTGDFVKQTAYTQGYAQLSAIYADILKKDKERFNSNKTADNAWQFFEDYTILWQLRFKGEEQYEKAQHVKSFFKLVDTVNINYIYKLPVIEANLNRLNDAMFTVSSDIVIPTSVKYMKKAVIHCPVDVYVYNSAGVLIATLRDGAESDITNSYGRFAVVYNPVIDEYEKVICQMTNEELNFKIYAIDSGLVNYDFAYLDSSKKIKIQSFDNEALNKGDAINITASEDTNKFEIDLSDDGIIDSSKTLSQNNSEYIKVVSINVEKSDFSLSVGDTEVIAVKINPANATYTLLNWSSGDNSIVEVDNGKITAKSAGNTEIYAQSANNPSVCMTIKVTVNDMTNIVPGDLNGSGGNPDVEDLILMQKLVAGWNVDDQIKTNADLDGKGGVDIDDLILLQKVVAGWKVNLKKVELNK